MIVQDLKRPQLPRKKPLTPKVAAYFLPEILLDFKESGEFRQVAPIFISFEGIPTPVVLHDWIGILLKRINDFGGYFVQLDFGDKGGTALCGFGAPVTYENVVDRALNCILAVKRDLIGFKNLSDLRFRAGITYGTAYAGFAGGEKRCVYTFYGEVVNLAARFMMKAAWGEILISQAMSAQASDFVCEHKDDWAYKGFADVVPTYALLGRKGEIRRKIFAEAMIGRQAELQTLREWIAPMRAGKFAGIA